MKNRHDFKLLERNADGKGNWQAKLAYAALLLEQDSKNKENAEKAKNYLYEVIESDVIEYALTAKKLFEIYFPDAGVRNTIALKAIENIQNAVPMPRYANYYRKIKDSPDYQYKIIRYKFNSLYHPYSVKNNESFITESLRRYEDLLNHQEMTDALRAKIYFQLFLIHIEQAKVTGQRNYLEKANQYCHLFITDATISSTTKAEGTLKINQEINKVTAIPVYNFTSHVKEAFKAGREGNRMLFKYTGIIVGNVMDFGMLGLPKTVGRYHGESGESMVQNTFKRGGMAWVCKEAGKLFGKHIMGNLIGGPIGALLGALTYPFFYLYHYNKSSQAINRTAKRVDTLLKEEKGKKGESTQATLTSIFAHRKDNDNLIKRIDYLDHELEQTIPIISKPLIFTQGKGKKASHPYGGIFSYPREKQPEVASSSPALPNNLAPLYRG